MLRINKMIKKILIVSILLLNSLMLFSYTHIEVPIELSDELGSNYRLVFGVDEKATDTWDSLLGELNAPRFPPPKNTFHAAFEIFDSIRTMDLCWSYKDFRPIINTRQYYVLYNVKVYRGDGNLLIFKWNTLPKEIDSAKITDRDELIVIVDINLTGSKRSDTITNKYMNEYFIKVWYSNPLAVAEDGVDNKDFFVYPVPTDGDKLFINSNSNGFTYKIYSETGIEMISGKSEGDETELIISKLVKGIYFIVLNSGDKQVVKKLVRL
ncbi:MAG: T9SS type A sorting domain-containing protein [Bacteroidetes bacterium]|nr:MAG: T9SS type A sorting domain-containing protein [Bacteroidota bacterium]